MHYDTSRTYFRSEEEFPGPKTMATAADWLRTSAPRHDRFFLFVDEFDPHEPFDTPEPYAGRYDPEWEGPLEIWPPYLVDAIAGGQLTERRAAHIRANYGSKLTMIDHWLGRLLGAIDEAGLRDSTAVTVCTDHGHYLGEHDLFGKPSAPVYSELGRIPLMIRWPGRPPGTIDALTTSVDLHATIGDFFGVSVRHPTHGRSLIPLVEGGAAGVRETALFGYWAGHIGLTDGHRRYLRGCGDRTFPLSMWSNRWSTMPVHAYPDLQLPRPDRRASLRLMPGTDVPVIAQPFAPGDLLPFWAYGPPARSHLFDVDDDPNELENRVGGKAESALADALADELRTVEAPADVLERVGLG